MKRVQFFDSQCIFSHHKAIAQRLWRSFRFLSALVRTVMLVYLLLPTENKYSDDGVWNDLPADIFLHRHWPFSSGA